MKHQLDEEDISPYSLDLISSPELIELARKRGREHARHMLLYYGINTIDPDRRIIVTEASEQEIACVQEANAVGQKDIRIHRERREAEEIAYLQSVEDAGGWNAFLEQRKVFHEEVDTERLRLWQVQLSLYGEQEGNMKVSDSY